MGICGSPPTRPIPQNAISALMRSAHVSRSRSPRCSTRTRSGLNRHVRHGAACGADRDARLQAEPRHILDTQLTDQRGAWDMLSDGSYVQRSGMGAKHSQQQAIERTERRLKEATRLRRRKVQSTARRKR